MTDLKKIDPTKPCETIPRNGEQPVGPLVISSDERRLIVRQCGSARMSNMLDEYGRLLGIPDYGPIIRNVQPTDAEIVAARLERASKRPMMPTGLVTREGESVEMVQSYGGGFHIAVRRGYWGIFCFTVMPTGKHGECDHPLDLLPAKDFQDE